MTARRCLMNYQKHPVICIDRPQATLSRRYYRVPFGDLIDHAKPSAAGTTCHCSAQANAQHSGAADDSGGHRRRSAYNRANSQRTIRPQRAHRVRLQTGARPGAARGGGAERRDHIQPRLTQRACRHPRGGFSLRSVVRSIAQATRRSGAIDPNFIGSQSRRAYRLLEQPGRGRARYQPAAALHQLR